MRAYLKNILHRLLGAGGYILINPAAYEASRKQMDEILSHMAALRGELADTRERLLETKGGVSQLQQQLGDTLSHVLVLRGEVRDARERLAETKGGVSKLQSESGETLSHMLALREEMAKASGGFAETRSRAPQGQVPFEVSPSQTGASRKKANGAGGHYWNDRLCDLPLQLDRIASGYSAADSALPGTVPSDTQNEMHDLAVHYARLANLVSQHWVAGSGPAADPYPDDDFSPEYASAAIDDQDCEAAPDNQKPSCPWRHLWTDPDCGVFLVIGEGGAANHSEAYYTPRGDVFSLDFRTMRCRRAQDPLAGASGEGGSIWSRLGDRLIESGVFRRVLFVPLAGEGSSIKDWTPEGVMHRRTAVVLSRLRKELGVSALPFSAVLWQHGETEANRSLMSAQAYKMHFHDIVADLRANGVFAPVFAACATLGKADGDVGQNRAKIRQALLDLPDPEGGIFAGPDIDTIGPEDEVDAGHFSAHGLERCAELWCDALRPRRPLIEKLDTMPASAVRG